MVRKHIFFSGRVQGVGFRYHAYNIAQSLALSGWVQNLYDGRVEMEVQGSERDIQELIHKLRQQRFIVIEDVEMHTIPVVIGELGFEMAN